MAAHSPTPWKSNLGEIVDANRVLVAVAEWGGPRKGERPTLANAARAVKCVNDCAGIDDPALALAEMRTLLAALDQLDDSTTSTEVLIPQLPRISYLRALLGTGA